jgi:hypothetical protein
VVFPLIRSRCLSLLLLFHRRGLLTPPRHISRRQQRLRRLPEKSGILFVRLDEALANFFLVLSVIVDLINTLIFLFVNLCVQRQKFFFHVFVIRGPYVSKRNKDNFKEGTEY